METIIVSTKPSNRKRERFKRLFPNAFFLGSASLGSKSKHYRMSLKEYNENKELLKELVTKARNQY